MYILTIVFLCIELVTSRNNKNSHFYLLFVKLSFKSGIKRDRERKKETPLFKRIIVPFY